LKIVTILPIFFTPVIALGTTRTTVGTFATFVALLTSSYFVHLLIEATPSIILSWTHFLLYIQSLFIEFAFLAPCRRHRTTHHQISLESGLLAHERCWFL